MLPTRRSWPRLLGESRGCARDAARHSAGAAKPRTGPGNGGFNGLAVCRSSAIRLPLAICMLLALPRETAPLPISHCSGGYTGNNGGVCTACVAGKYKDTVGSAECSDCPAGKYGDTVGSAECSDCPSSDFTSAVGSDDVTDCECNAGYTGPDGVSCTACVAGKFKPSEGPAPCIQCTAGKASAALAAVGMSTCVDCAGDTYSNNRMTDCLPCVAHSSSARRSGNNTDCKCNAGFSGPDGGSCTACESPPPQTPPTPPTPPPPSVANA